ncbi:MAG: B12-binding domain-containing protein, partial [Alistipes sp.]|nr:B12-binding domain-containing protein [Alistipes sp.]
RELGAALVVMAFDEQGQATSYERKIEVCERAYRLLTERLGFDARDIIFDPNVLTIATGMREHDSYALDFIRATQWIRENLKGARVSGGVSNLSFSLRGNNYLREAMHAVFLYHAIRAGLDMAIVNPATKVMYDDIPAPLLEVLEDTILCRREDATERLISMAEQYRAVAEEVKPAVERHTISLEQRLAEALQHGDDEYLQADLDEALRSYPSPAAIIEGPLMRGMSIVGELFGEGRMFLPQVVKTARTMKRAVEILQPYIEAQNLGTSGKSGRFLLATVKGDVHDIGKNIAAVVLACNNFDVIDLGVMVPSEQIVRAAVEHQADYIGLSGLITPSLDEMCRVAQELKAAGVSVPLFIGGATTSALHTALKIAPLYDGPVFHVKDAAQNPIIAMQLSGSEREKTIACLRYEQQCLREQSVAQPTPMEQSDEHRLKIDWSNESIIRPTYLGVREIKNIAISDVRPYINWTHFYNLWGVRAATAEAEQIRSEAEQLLDAMSHHLRAKVGF